MDNAKKKYKKGIVLQYKYIDSSESATALAEVFDDIFIRLTKKQSERGATKFNSSAEVILIQAI